VRPLRLELDGFTAFRERQDVDFEELELFVITGPTGAGKTSILDAMVFALYGQVPRLGGKQGTAELVSLGSAQARVMFEFSVKGKGRYRVARRLKRRGAQTATLERLEGEDWVSAVERDGVRECQQVLDTLLGLDFDSFCKAVVLPQGEFHRFLKGDPRERRKVLVSLLGVSYFERMGALARTRHADLSSRVARSEEIITERYAQASSEGVASAHAASIEAAELASALSGSLADADQRSKEAVEHARRAQALLTAIEELGILADGSRGCAERCHVVELGVGETRQALEERSAEHERAGQVVNEANASVTVVETQTGSIDSIAQAGAAAQTLASASEQESEAAQKLTGASRAQQAAEKELASAQEDEANHAPGVQQAITTEDASAAVNEAAKQSAQTLEQAARDAGRAASELVSAREQLQTDSALAASAVGEAQTLEAALAQASAHLEAHRRANARAELAEGVGVDDPCPVCGVALGAPLVFESNVIEALASAREAEMQARTGAERARSGAASAQASTEGAQRTVDERQRAQTEALDGHADLASMNEARDTALAAVAKAETDLAGARVRREELQDAARRAHDRSLTAQVELEGKRALSEQASTVLQEVLERKQGALATLADRFKGEVPADAVEQIAAQRELLQAASHTSEEARAALESANAAREQARGAVTGAEQALAALDIELTRLRTLAQSKVDSLPRTPENSGGPPSASASRASDAAELASWCEAVAAATSVAHQQASEAREACEALILAIGARHDLTASDSERMLSELRASERGSREAATKAQSTEEEAKRRLEEREAMEKTIRGERAQIAVLAELVNELRGDHFGDYIVNETLQILAARASQELLQISDGRYSLLSVDGDFEVIDHANADERRSVKTLSGGETFLASLALALALSRHVGDLASEGLGAKLEAVFVDEGFGTLDPETLDDVIDALERLRAEDLLVGVISHVPELAQRIRSGLEVQKSEGRSTILASAGG
jgi:exonuclease SbcC